MLSRRATGLELIDRPDADQDLVRRSHAFMRAVNRCLGGARLVRRFVAREARRGNGVLRVLDLGSGTCDIPLAVSRWARRRGLDVAFTCIESNSHAAALARQSIEPGQPIEVVEADASHYEPAETFHCAVGSMFFHHFEDREALDLLIGLRTHVSRSILVNDLLRGWRHYAGARLLTAFVGKDVRHDALLSVRRGFRARELAALLSQLHGASVDAGTAWLFRVWAVARFDGEDVS